MLAQQNEYIKEAVSGIAVLTEDERIRQQCQARKDFEYWERIKENGHRRELEEKDNFYQQELAKKDSLLAEKEKQHQMELAKLTARIAELEAHNK